MKQEMIFKCNICGKILSNYYYDFGNYAYKINNKYYCSWSCYKKALKENCMSEYEFLERNIVALESNIDIISKKIDRLKNNDERITDINYELANCIEITKNILNKFKERKL